MSRAVTWRYTSLPNQKRNHACSNGSRPNGWCRPHVHGVVCPARAMSVRPSFVRREFVAVIAQFALV